MIYLSAIACAGQAGLAQAGLAQAGLTREGPAREGPGPEGFRVLPYLQQPSAEAITVIWFSETGSPGILSHKKKDSPESIKEYSSPEVAGSLAYPAWEESTYFGGHAPPPPYRHRIRLENLGPATTYEYQVIQDSVIYSSEFRTAPEGDSAIRFIVYGDCETEPESTGKYAYWSDPVTGIVRYYLVDQTRGYRNNLEVIRSRDPDLVFIAGDLVESGGEQRDWDEFWRHNAGMEDSPGLAGRIPVMAALGNHEYHEGPYMGGWDQPGSEYAVSRYQSYFEYPPNGSPVAESCQRH